MTPQQAADVVAVLRTMYPDGDAPGELLASYATILATYDHQAALLGVDRLMHTYQSRRFPPIARVEEMIRAANPADAAWEQLAAHLESGATSPPAWPDAAARSAVGRLGGWGIIHGWDGSRALLRESFLRAYDDAVTAEQAAVASVPQLGMGAKTVNVSGDERCPYCGNDGWVDLHGTVEDQGMTYPLGATACRWCELGEIVYTSSTTGKRAHGRKARPVHLRSDYTEDDMLDRPVAPDGPRLSLAEYAASPAGQHDAALRDPRVRQTLGLDAA